jgi:hypothetical protein
MKNRLVIVLTTIFFLGFLGLGLLVFKDYGIPWDEEVQVQVGLYNHLYIFQGDQTLLTYENRYYGAIFELLLFWGQVKLAIPRHLGVFLIFFAGVIVFYALARRLFQKPWWSLLATVAFIASPRIFADSFYNSKDIPFLFTAVLAVFSLILLGDTLVKRGCKASAILAACLHTLASAVFISTRVPGLMIIPLSLLVFFILMIKTPDLRGRLAVIAVGYLVITTGLTILLWPILWHNPWGEFINAFNQMSRYPWNRTMLYMGNFIYASSLPWHYLPVWIGITTPLMVLAGFMLGLFNGIFNLSKLTFTGKKANPPSSSVGLSPWVVWMIIAAWLVVPVSSIYAFHSIIYDGWRQMYFIYPTILLVAVKGIKFAFERILQIAGSRQWLRSCMVLLMLVGLAEPTWFMIRYHPFQNVYFNILAGERSSLRQRFELDYWGLSYKQAIDAILTHDPRDEIKISVANPPGFFYVNDGLPAALKRRIIKVRDPKEADYFVSNFRWHPDDYELGEVFYTINICSTKIMEVYKIQP